jgi:hypothetical protein
MPRGALSSIPSEEFATLFQRCAALVCRHHGFDPLMF